MVLGAATACRLCCGRWAERRHPPQRQPVHEEAAGLARINGGTLTDPQPRRPEHPRRRHTPLPTQVLLA